MGRGEATKGKVRVTVHRVLASLVLFLPATGVPAPAATNDTAGITHALLINGGSRPETNYQSHLHHLQDMLAVLEARGIPASRIHVFSADGEHDAPDLAVRDPLPASFWLLEGTRVGAALRPRTETTDTRWPGVELKPATKRELEAWFRKARRTLRPGDRLFVFVTDHGTENEADLDDGAISLWKEKLTVREFERLVGRLRTGVQVVMVMSQCYSGTFASAMHDEPDAEPSGQTCGFFSTARDLRAYGCYPEGRDRDRIGHAFQFIAALGRRETTDGAHLEVLFTDWTPDVPLRTSDVYLAQVVEAEARDRGIAKDALVDELLQRAWSERAAWEPEIRLIDRIGATYGMFSPRSLEELAAYEEPLPGLIERAKNYAGRWQAAQGGVATEALRGFVEEHPEWRERLEEGSLKKFPAEERRQTLDELLPPFEQYVTGRPELHARLADLHERASRASEAEWRLEIRLAAVRRMRTILVGIAGRVLLAEAGAGEAPRRARREALERLERCEAFEPGTLPASSGLLPEPVIGRLPPLADELSLLDEVLPAWLGVRYGRIPAAVTEGRSLPEGATWISDVFPDSPASEAGLESGGIVLGPPGRPFTAPEQLREWTMTSPPGAALKLTAVRPASDPADDRTFDVELRLQPLPLEWPKLPAPPDVGDAAPPLPEGMVPVAGPGLPDLQGTPHLLFFWATWCEPCKRAVPEVIAFAARENLPVLAISDEDPKLLEEFLGRRKEPFFEHVAADPLRRSFRAWGVSGTPTIVWIGDDGTVRRRQVGYDPGKGIRFEGDPVPGP